MPEPEACGTDYLICPAGTESWVLCDGLGVIYRMSSVQELLDMALVPARRFYQRLSIEIRPTREPQE